MKKLDRWLLQGLWLFVFVWTLWAMADGWLLINNQDGSPQQAAAAAWTCAKIAGPYVAVRAIEGAVAAFYP